MMRTETIKRVLELKRADFNLAQYALDKGHSITVDYGDEDGCTKSKDFNQIKEAADAICDEYHMHIYDSENRKLGWAWVVYGNDDHELVADYTANKFMDEWWASYESAYGGEM